MKGVRTNGIKSLAGKGLRLKGVQRERHHGSCRWNKTTTATTTRTTAAKTTTTTATTTTTTITTTTTTTIPKSAQALSEDFKSQFTPTF